jgi:hypothetical protein
MNTTPRLAEVTVIRRCELCDTPLEYALGDRQLEFAGHSPELCRVGTLERIRGLQDALKAKDALYQTQAAEFARRVDEHLARHGLPTLAERQRLAEVNARLAAISPTGLRGLEP